MTNEEILLTNSNAYLIGNGHSRSGTDVYIDQSKDKKIRKSYFDNQYIHKSVPSEIFMRNLKRLNSHQAIISNILPRNLRFIHEYKGTTILVIEEEPMMRTVSMSMDLTTQFQEMMFNGNGEKFGYTEEYWLSLDQPYRFSLMFPYIIFVMVLQESEHGVGELPGINMYPFLRLGPITCLSDYLFKVPLYNINTDQRICLGNINELSDIYNNKNLQTYNPTNLVTLLIDSFWQSPFNTDYSYNVRAYDSTPIIRNIFEWEYYSKTDPMFIYDIEWISYEKNNLSTMMDELFIKHNNRRRTRTLLPLKGLFNKFDDRAELRSISETSEAISIEGIVLAIGDEIDICGTKFYVNKFEAISENASTDCRIVKVEFMFVETEDGELIKVTLTPDMKEQLYEIITFHNRLETTILEDGTCIKVGDFIEILQPSELRFSITTVEEIKPRRDGRVEIHTSSIKLFSYNLVCKVLDSEKLLMDIFEMNVKEGNNYYLHRRTDSDTVYYVKLMKIHDLYIKEKNNAYFSCDLVDVYDSVDTFNKIRVGPRNDARFIREEDIKRVSHCVRKGK